MDGTEKSELALREGATLDKVCAIISDVFGIPRSEVDETTVQDDIPEWDSIGHLNLMLALEEAFDVSFAVDEMPNLVSVAAIARRVQD